MRTLGLSTCTKGAKAFLLICSASAFARASAVSAAASAWLTTCARASACVETARTASLTVLRSVPFSGTPAALSWLESLSGATVDAFICGCDCTSVRVFCRQIRCSSISRVQPSSSSLNCTSAECSCSLCASRCPFRPPLSEPPTTTCRRIMSSSACRRNSSSASATAMGTEGRAAANASDTLLRSSRQAASRSASKRRSPGALHGRSSFSEAAPGLSMGHPLMSTPVDGCSAR
mmetsp:Transcript_20659/g.64098  ORF Transcript_20659/g.64098 Transcript_20659/m.64098 type:complete len:234 (-) Transcript_20659:1750-2451(-)